MPHQHLISLTNEVLVDIVGASSDDSDFAEQGEGDPVDSAHKAVDLLVAAGLLLPKLVAGESQHIEVIRPKVPLELLQVFVVFLGEATFTGYIHHQGHLRPQRHMVKPTLYNHSPERQTAVSHAEHALCTSSVSLLACVCLGYEYSVCDSQLKTQ